MKKITLLWCFAFCLVGTLQAQTQAELAEIRAAKASTSEVVNVQELLNRSTTISPSAREASEGFTNHEHAALLQHYRPQNNNRLADIIPTAGATETFMANVGDFVYDPSDGINGGPGGDCSSTGSGDPGDYPNCDCITVTTLTAPAGEEISVTFNSFRVFGSFDWFAIFDGSGPVTATNGSGSATNPTSGDPELWNSSVDGDELVDMTNAGMTTFTSTNGSLTFASRFSGVVNTCGWEAEVVPAGGGGGCGIASDCNLMDSTPDDATSPDIWDRPFAGGTCCSTGGPVSYDLYGPFTVDTAGNYTFTNTYTTAGYDGYMFLYENCFDPLDQLNGFVAGDDDFMGLGGSQMLDIPLTTGTEYYVVTTGFSAGDFGDYELVITGAGAATCGGGGGGGCGSAFPNYANVSPGGNGVPSQDFTPANDAFDCMSADDFIIPASPNNFASVCSVDFTVSYTAGGLPAEPTNMLNFTIYADAGDMPGSPVYSESFLGTDIDPDGDGLFTVTPSTPPALVSGTKYWMSIQASMSFAGSGQMFWSTADDAQDSDLHFQNPGDGFGSGCTAWNDITTCAVGGGGANGTDHLMDISFGEVVTNDECADAFPVACGAIIVGETINDSDSGGNPANDEFYTYTGPGSPEFVTLSTCGTADFDTVLRVFEDCSLTNEIAFNDDAAGCAGFTSELTFLSDGTSTYYIMVEGFGSASGNFELSVTCDAVAANDLCENAIEIACGSVTAGSTTFATLDDSVAGNCNDTFDPTPFNPTVDVTAPGVWYTYTETNPGLVTDITLNLCDDADFDTKISVYTGDCGTLTCVAANDDNDDCTGFTSTVEFQSDGVSTYYILVHGFGSSTGDFNLTMDCVPVAPPNDMIANSIDVDEIGFPYTDPAVNMPGATVEGGTPADCNNAGVLGVWYNFTPVVGGDARCAVLNPDGYTSVTFYEAPNESAIESDLVLVDWFDNQCVPGVETTIPVTAGQAYYVYVANHGTVTDIVIDGSALGVGDAIVEGFTYYPNPAMDELNLNAGVKTIDSATIYNILGQEVVQTSVAASNTTLNVANLSVGTYVLKVVVDGEVGIYKIVKQ